MTKEGQLLAALSYLDTAWKSAMKTSLLVTDKNKAEYINGLANALHDEYLAMESEALRAPKKFGVYPAEKGGKTPDSTITP